MRNSSATSSKRYRTFSSFACVALLLIAGCHKADQPRQEITIEHEIAPQPARIGIATITLKLVDGSEKPVTGATILLEGNMSHAGMGPTFGTAKEIVTGRYQAPLEFSMAGDWIVLVHVTLSDGQKLERQFEVRGVRSD